MSKRKNVHPDHYKTRGSGRQGEGVVHRKHREQLARNEADLEERQGWRQRDEESREKQDANNA